MNIYDMFGFSGSVLIAIAFVPQTYKTLTQENTNDISIPFMSITLISAGLVLAYGFHYTLWPVIISNICVALNCIIIISYINLKKHKISNNDNNII